MGQERSTAATAVAAIDSNAVRVAVNFGVQYGSGVILSPVGVVVTCKHAIYGYSDGRIELSNGMQVEFSVLKEVEGKDLIFLVTSVPVESVPAKVRENATLQEGEELVCRASVAQTVVCTIRGSLAYVPRPNSKGVLVAQVPLSPGASGATLFDLNGHIVGICIGPVTEKEMNFARAWSGDVIRDAIKDNFGDSWAGYLSDVTVESLSVKSDGGKSDLRTGDKIESVNGVSITSDLDFLLAGAALSARNEKQVLIGVVRSGKSEKIEIVRP
jgi:S1-C subfamily serine protease